MTSSLRNDAYRLIKLAQMEDDTASRAEALIDSLEGFAQTAATMIALDARAKAELFRELAEEAL
jgi:hypothetical protein